MSLVVIGGDGGGGSRFFVTCLVTRVGLGAFGGSVFLIGELSPFSSTILACFEDSRLP